jgi:endogenous inhibitor of DNA gyrase (YacG/DUF329 family)
MPRAACRCGQILNVPDDGPERVTCPKCGARVRIRRHAAAPSASAAADGFIRFFCPCGRRLKVNAERPPSHGKCPDCGRVVPVPAAGVGMPAHPEAPTEDLSPADRAALERWSRSHLAKDEPAPVPASTTDIVASPPLPQEAERAEVGLRVCPTCGRPVHLGAEVCRGCGTPVPRR